MGMWKSDILFYPVKGKEIETWIIGQHFRSSSSQNGPTLHTDTKTSTPTK